MTEQDHAADPSAAPSPEAAGPDGPQAKPTTIGYMVNCFPANAPTGPQLGVSIGVGFPVNGQQLLNSVFWIPEDQAEGFGAAVVEAIAKELAKIRAARVGAPAPGLVLPGTPGFGMPPESPNGARH